MLHVLLTLNNHLQVTDSAISLGMTLYAKRGDREMKSYDAVDIFNQWINLQ